MLVIYKYTLGTTPDRVCAITMPASAQFLAVHFQEPNGVRLWFECESDAIQETTRRFVLRFTGHEFPYGGKYLGTCLHRSLAAVAYLLSEWFSLEEP